MASNKTKRVIDLIGYDCGWGSRDYGCEDGPEALDHPALVKILENHGHTAQWVGCLGIKNYADRATFEDKHDAFPFLFKAVTTLNEAVQTSLKKGHTPIVLGGDHSSAIGTWSGAVTALNMHEKFGLIWFDAHMDAHTPETANEGKWGGWWHGMPVACLLGHGAKELTTVGSDSAKLSANHISLLGIRSYEPGEEAFLKQHKVKIHAMNDIDEQNFNAVFKDSLARATQATQGFGVSIDLDGFDPERAPGVGTAEPGGLRGRYVIPALKGLAQNPDFTALEIVEYNPHHGEAGRTRELIHNLIDSIFS